MFVFHCIFVGILEGTWGFEQICEGGGVLILTFQQPLPTGLDHWRASGGFRSTPSYRSCVGGEGGVGPDLLCGEVSL